MPLGGLIAPMPTVFDASEALAPADNAEFARHLATAGVDHLLVLGTLGEFPSVEESERSTLISAIRDGAGGKADLWVGCGAPSTERAVRFARQAVGLGAAALVVVPPYYLHPTDRAIEEYYRSVASAVARPVLAYNIPSKVGYELPAELAHQLGRDGVLAGVKDTSGSLESVERFLDGAPPGFVVCPGDDPLVRESMARGAAGAVMGTANVVPSLAHALVDSCRAGDSARSSALQRLVDRLAAVITLGPFPSTVKYLAQEAWGARVGYRSPYGPLREEERDRVEPAWQALRPALAEFLRG